MEILINCTINYFNKYTYFYKTELLNILHREAIPNNADVT